MATSELILWAVIGGLIVAVLSMMAVVYNKQEQNMKHIGRDFILGAATTGFLYPLIPESFDDMKMAVTGLGGSNNLVDTLKDAVSAVASSAAGTGLDPGVKVGPANF
jgi:hypothetical protein